MEFISAGHFTAGYPWIRGIRSVNSYEVMIGLSDTIYIQQDDERFEVEPGEALLLLLNRTHFGYAYSGPQVSFCWVHFQIAHDRSVLLEEQEGLAEIARYLNNPYAQSPVPSVLKVGCLRRSTYNKRQIASKNG